MGELIRDRYEAGCEGYDELYGEEQVLKYFLALRRVRPGGVVLDAGCGTGLLAEFMSSTGLIRQVTGIICLDYSRCMLGLARARANRICRGKCHIVMGDVGELPLPDRSVDISYAFTVLDLLGDPLKGLRELVRVSREYVVVSYMKRLENYRDVKAYGGELIGETPTDLIFRVKVAVRRALYEDL